jgi:hypothetical protein
MTRPTGVLCSTPRRSDRGGAGTERRDGRAGATAWRRDAENAHDAIETAT